MRKIKTIGAERLKYHLSELFNRLHDKPGKAVRIEVETPVSNQELCTEIRKSIDYLNNLIKVAKKRNIKVILSTSHLSLPVELENTKVDICETKRY